MTRYDRKEMAHTLLVLRSLERKARPLNSDVADGMHAVIRDVTRALRRLPKHHRIVRQRQTA